MRPEHRPRDDAPVEPFAQLADALRGMLATLHDLAAEVEAALEGRRELAGTLRGMLRKLVDARAETEAALEREYELLRYVSHELRTPLTSALTNLEVLAAELQGEQAELAHAALHSTDRMVRLVEDLLLLSRADARRSHPRVRVDLGEVLIDVAGELEPIAHGHQLSVHAQRAVVLGVHDDLHRLVLNLAANAFRHTPEGTHVEMRSGVWNGEAVVTVEDDGAGIPPGLEDRMFDRFARAAGKEAGGSGLGLAIVRAVAESHGGTVALERPASGRGAGFVVRIPALPPAARHGRAEGVRSVA
jgi:two-component system, OmpR family, sensor kinase